jgi:hypothetical protein
MMRVEILHLDTLQATVRVTDDADGVASVFTCGAGDKAHEALRVMVYNAARELAQKRTDREMIAFGKREERT